MEPITDLFGNIGEDFQSHLESKNERVVFSGAFGIGKTTFLNWFFNASESKDEYEVFHLFPVNYSVLSNEDIFKYIKYDIVYELMEKNALQVDSSSSDESIYSRSSLISLSKSLLLLIPKMGRQLHKFTSEIQELIDQGNKGKEEKTLISDLLNSYTKHYGDLYEFNALTQIINDSIKKIKTPKKKTVLIIDDLDRIDPNHIFRLFNVFAAHFDKSRNVHENKFGFDHIVMVCDIQNIKHIYRHKYGIQTDFNGYIDKFYSREIYFFDNYDNISSFLKRLFDSIEFVGYSERHSKYINSNKNLKKDLVFLFQNLIISRQITLRNLMRYHKGIIRLDSGYIESLELNDWEFSALYLVRITKCFFVDYESFKRAVDWSKNSENLVSSSNLSFALGDLIALLDSKNQERKANIIAVYKDFDRKIIIRYKRSREGDLGIFYVNNVSVANSREAELENESENILFVEEPTLTVNMYFDYLSKALTMLKTANYLH